MLRVWLGCHLDAYISVFGWGKNRGGKGVGFKPSFERIWSRGVMVYRKERTEKLNPKNLVLVHQIRAFRKKKKDHTTQETQLNQSNPKGPRIFWPPRWSNVGMRLNINENNEPNLMEYVCMYIYMGCLMHYLPHGNLICRFFSLS